MKDNDVKEKKKRKAFLLPWILGNVGEETVTDVNRLFC